LKYFIKLNIIHRVTDPHHFNADPNPALIRFHFSAGADPDPHKSDGNLRPQVFRPSRAPFFRHQDSIHGSGLSLLKLLNFECNADPNPAFHSNADPDPDLACKNNADPDPQP
jgi:hypothetical protein